MVQATHPGHRVEASRTKLELSDARQRLLRMMQFISFGRIERLHVKAGEPVFEPAPLVLRTVKLTGNNESRPELALTDFLLKREIVELFAQLDQLGDGVIEKIEIAHGLPLLMVVPQALAG